MGRKMLMLAFVLLLSAASTVYVYSAQMAETPRCCDGRVWLSMSKSQRHTFVAGFIAGVQHGHLEGCIAYDKLAKPEFSVKSPEESPLSRCMGRQLRFEKPFAFYEDRITRFYEKYREDRDLGFPVLFYSVSDDQGLTDEQIHASKKALLGRR